MSPWIEVTRADAGGPDAAATATIMRSAIAFSAHFVRSHPDVLAARWVRLYVDDGARRVGFRFADKPLENALTLTPNGRKKNTVGRVVQTQALFTKYPWLRAVAESRSPRDRRFQVNWDPVDTLYFISLRPAFERSARTPTEIPNGTVGIYRYLRGTDVVYIGQGDVRARASQDHRASWQFDRIEYSTLADEKDRFQSEAYWLEQHKRTHGALPEYNRIGGRSSSADAAQQLAATDGARRR